MFDVNFRGIDCRQVTMKLGSGIVTSQTLDVPVKVSGEKTVDECADGDDFYGKLLQIEFDNFGTVQRKGFTGFSYSGASPGCGYVGLVADGAGGVKAGAGKKYHVVSIDASNNKLWLDL